MASLVAIADDLTGAADCAATGAVHGMRATVALHGPTHPDLDLHWPEADIVSIDANTRGATAREAAQTTAALAKLAFAHSTDAVLFKKVDSTLRGNLAAELAGILHACREALGSRARAMILAPALPAQGRATIGGRQLVHGRLLEETDLWKSEARVPRSNISAMLAQGGLSSHVIDLATVRAEVSLLTRTLTDFAHTVDVLICDAETEDDLKRIGQAAMDGGFPLWAGSAGLAAHLPQAMGVKRQANGNGRPVLVAGPTLIVVGSAASIAREQAGILAAAPGVVSVRLNLEMTHNAQNHSAEIVAALHAGHDTLVIVDDSNGTRSQMFAETLAHLLKPCAGLFGGLIATGGETARAILDGLGIDRLQLLGEVEPGLPFSVAEGWMRPLPVLTKAGAFGSPESLLRGREFLRNLPNADERHTFTTREI